MTTEKNITFTIGIRDIIIVVLAFLLWFSNCSGGKEEVSYKKGNYDSLLVKLKSDSILIVSMMEKSYQDSLKTVASERKSDSLTIVKDKYVALYHSSRKVVLTQISEGVCDTNSIKQVINDCDSTITSAKNESIQKDSTIADLKIEVGGLKEQLKVSNGMVDASRTILNGQSNDIKALEKEVVDIKKKNKRIGILATIGGVLKDIGLIFALKK